MMTLAVNRIAHGGRGAGLPLSPLEPLAIGDFDFRTQSESSYKQGFNSRRAPKWACKPVGSGNRIWNDPNTASHSGPEFDFRPWLHRLSRIATAPTDMVRSTNLSIRGRYFMAPLGGRTVRCCKSGATTLGAWQGYGVGKLRAVGGSENPTEPQCSVYANLRILFATTWSLQNSYALANFDRTSEPRVHNITIHSRGIRAVTIPLTTAGKVSLKARVSCEKPAIVLNRSDVKASSAATIPAKDQIVTGWTDQPITRSAA